MNDLEKKYCSEFFRDPSRNPKTNRKIIATGKVYKDLVKMCDKYRDRPKSKSKSKKSHDICSKWLKNKNINPRTNRKITTTGLVYKKLEKECLPPKPKSPSKRKSITYSNYSQSSLTASEESKKFEESKEYPSPIRISKIHIKDELQWDGHPTLKLTEMSKCLQDIIVYKYLSHGAYGVVYKVKYKGKDCAMKLSIIDENPIEPTRRKNTLQQLEKEYELFKKVSDLGIAPKVYLFKTCNVKMPKKFKNKEIKISIMIIELMDITLEDYMKKLSESLEKYLINPLKFKSFKKFEDKVSRIIKKLTKIDDKIKSDSLRSIRELGVNNRDTHSENIMLKKGIPYITDWGLISNKKIQSPHEEHNRDYYFTIQWLENFMRKHRSLLSRQSYKNHLNSLKISLDSLNFRKFTYPNIV